MRSFAEECPDNNFVQQIAAQKPRLRNGVILDNVRDVQEIIRQITSIYYERSNLSGNREESGPSRDRFLFPQKYLFI